MSEIDVLPESAFATLRTDIERLRAENAALRLALKKYADSGSWLYGGLGTSYVWFDGQSHPANIAREALEPKP